MSNKVVRDLIEFERDAGLFSESYEGVPLWEVSRDKVFNRLRSKSFEKIQEKSSNIYSSLLDGLKNYISTKSDSQLFSENSEVLILNHPRRKKENGLYVDIYTDPFLDDLELNFLVLEQSYKLSHKTPVKNTNIIYLDNIEFNGILLGEYYKYKLFYFATPVQRLAKLVSDRFELNFSYIRNIIAQRAARFYYYYRRLSKVFKKISPKILIEVPHYTDINRAFNMIAKENDIPVVELQHGIISGDHIRYNYLVDDLKTFPDYIFLWGQFWKKNVDFPLSKENLLEVGFPYLEKKKSEIFKPDSKNNILFISQWTIGTELSNVAYDLAVFLPEINIIYKLHPKEYGIMNESYKKLASLENVKIISGDEPSLYTLLNKSSIQIGVYSTALIEGLMFEIPTFIIQLPGWENFSSFKQYDSFEFVADSETLRDKISTNIENRSFNNHGNVFFSKNSISKFKKGIKRLMQKGNL